MASSRKFATPRKMVSEARIHHYLPQCYLRGFTDPGGKKAELFVYDLREERVFSTHPKNIGARRDFNRIEIDGHRQDALEQGLASFEGHAAAVLKRIRHAQRLPEGEDFFVLMNLIGLIAVRNPHHRKTMNDFHAEIARSIMDLTFATKDQLEATIRKMKPNGVGIDEGVSFEDLKKFHEEGHYDIKTSRDWLISLELHGFEAVLPTLLHRKWVLYIADTGAGTFVSGDHPVTLTWTDPELQKGPYPPGHGMRSTELVFPLTSQLALIGTFEGKRKEVRASRRVVSAINSRVVMFLERHIYAAHRSFEFFGRDGSILPSKELFSQFAEHT